ncbi:type VI secretion system-associated FHA domain protein TagH [Marinibactrum halimedae]|uniref:FHA domain-containing protein n=1 Tax=Marinibactrum halimedae TaxID=1444977 RepID=A0AA37T5E0_9GAMM|nr:type VI secretion system-associated FHA domain protein TagH [Marinibactrum halimedae]MCD9458352.1 type VI secretion system-associated FHA domain protein TagH [Marinibactrum halimedae]GLS26049.1 hypothetical protein GCM10007877_17640 [Marinibactrum halimedae]
MELTLVIIEAPEHSNMLNHTKVFPTTGGSFGRSEKNFWVLPDPNRIISSEHANIACAAGQFTLNDVSTNGTYVNDSKSPIGKGKSHTLQNGDIIVCGEYKLKAVLPTEAPKQAAPKAGAGSFLDDADKTTFTSSPAAAQSAAHDDAQSLDKWLDNPAGGHKSDSHASDWGDGFASISDPNQANSLDPLASPPNNTGGLNTGGLSGNYSNSNQFGSDSFSAGGFDSNNFDSNNFDSNNFDSNNFGSSNLDSNSFSSDGFGSNSNADPFSGLNDANVSPPNSGLNSGNDPLSGFSNESPASNGPESWGNDDDWWKEPSVADNTPAINHAVPNVRAEQPKQNTMDTPSPSNPSMGTADGSNFNQARQQPPATKQPPAINNQSQFGNDPAFSHSQISADAHQADPLEGFGGSNVQSNTSAPAEEPAWAQTPPNRPIDDGLIDDGLTDNRANDNKGAAPQGQPLIGGFTATEQTPHAQSPSQQPLNQPLHQQQPPASEWQNAPSQSHSAAGTNSGVALNAQQPTPHAPPSSNNDGSSDSLAALLGIDAARIPANRSLNQEVSEMISETVVRLIDLLRARSAIKNELRVQRTMIKTTDNNPLKFSVLPKDAMNAMFGEQSQSFMSPPQAIKDSFDDLSDHQVAVLSGMRAAYDTMLEQFSPENLERRFNNKGSLISNKSAKNWDSFSAYYKELVADREKTYYRLFGDTFADAYEKQLSDIKATRDFTNKNR